MKFFNNLGIKARMMLLTLVPTFVITIFLTSYSISKSIDILQQSLMTNGKVIASQIAPASEYGVLSGNTNQLRMMIHHMLSRQHNITAITILDNNGNTIVSEGENTQYPRALELSDQTINTAGNDSALFISAPIKRNLVEIDDFFDPSEPIDEQLSTQPLIGHVLVTLSKRSIQSTQRSMIWKSALLGLIGFLISSYLAYRLGRSITEPIVVMAEAMENSSVDHFNLHVDEDAAGEIKTLQLGFNHMASHIQMAHDSLQDKVHDATQQLRHQAQHDALTGLVNRQEFDRRLNNALNDVKAQNAQHIFCYMDLDQFKVVNDTCGHHAGDELLRQISLILSQRVREEDTFARLGGDEFGLLLTNCDVDNAMRIAESMRVMIEDFRFVHQHRMFRVGVSIGMVEITKDMQDLGDITSHADAACYSAKDNGRNQIHLFRVQDDELAKRQVEMEWVTRINEAIENNLFTLYCQPIVPLQQNKEQMFYEILIRKVDPYGEITSPGAFIPAAERFHLMPKIDRWVIRETFSLFNTIIDPNDANDFLLTINLSGMSLSDKGLLDFIKTELETHNVPANRICFEITETSAIINLSNTLSLMEELHALGCQFLLDDFGSGMSSFAYLKNLPVSYLKMDGSFVRDITRDKIDYAMAKSIQSIAESMQIKTIAEFVEDAETMELLKKMGVDFGQGFYLSQPAPVERVLGNSKQLSLLVNQ